MKIKCYSVRLECLSEISDMALKAIDFNGNEDIIPSSQFFGVDYDVGKSNTYWISAWILDKKCLTYSDKKVRFFDKDTGRMLPTITIEHHTPEIINKEVEVNDELTR